ncbi:MULTISPECIES: RagB/SusD family nutrient uptake outer membrane protein [Chitinophagaceae]
MKRNPNIILLSFLLIGMVSCQKNFLDRYPQTTISPELFFNSESDLSEYINGLLNQPGTSQYLSDQSSDNTATTGSIEIKNMMTGSPTSQNITSGWSWTRLRNINYFLENYDKAQVTQDVKDHYVGLAKYYRAQFYMSMVQRYSDVPWYSQTIDPTDSAALYMARSPRSQVVDSIMSDLLFASTHVRESVSAGTPGLWAVMTIYARIALYEGTYRKYHSELNLQSTAGRFLDTAKVIAQRIMTSGKFNIYNTGNPSKDYATLFNSQDLSANLEVILNTPYDLSKKGAASSNINSTVFGDYEQSASHDLVQSYLMTDGTRFTDINNYQQKTFPQEFINRDPRLSQTIAYPGFQRVQDAAPYIQRLNKNFTGYHQLKGYINSTDNTIIGSTDFPVLRYAEVLLIYAEAAAELGTLTQSDLDNTVNLLRNRAGMPHLLLTTANSNPDPVLVAKYPDVIGAMQGVILEIRRERRVEFALEGYRYDDLMRWHAGKLLEKIPEGMYFPGLGQYDMTGDGVADIILIDKDASIPADDQKIKNSLGTTLVYYKAGSFGENVTVYLRNGNAGGTLVTETTTRQFIEPQYYYRPIPYQQTVLNPNLVQIFGW